MGQQEEAQEFTEKGTQACVATPEELVRLWEGREPNEWERQPEFFLEYGKRALELGQPALGYEILMVGRSVAPDEIILEYWAALALGRAGSNQVAKELTDGLLDRVDRNDSLYPDVLGLAGSIAKENCLRCQDETKRRRAATASANYYNRSFVLGGQYYQGINAATMSLVAGRQAESQRLAEAVKTLCESETQRSGSEDYWLLATLGEANLLLGQHADAATWYRKAVDAAHERYGDIASMRRQVKLLSKIIDVSPELEKAIAIPAVVAFTGIMMDAPDRPVPRFTPELEPAVRDAIGCTIDRWNVGFGYCSAACGADILFVEEMIKRNCQVQIILPFKYRDFVQESVAFAGEQWIARFENALAKAARVRYATSEGYLNDDQLFVYAQYLIEGYALLRAQQLATDPTMVAVIDPQSEIVVGGAAHAVQRWKEGTYPLEIIDMSKIRRSDNTPAKATQTGEISSGSARQAVGITRELKSMLFADVVGFSKLQEEDAPSFFVTFMEQVAHIIAESEPPPDFSNTWGDGLFLVFDKIDVAARFALRLRDIVAEIDWRAVGLPPETSIRIGMHVGPVYAAFDPIIERKNYFGSHVTNAARIEPITTPGSVFVTEQAACLLARYRADEFACDYLGATSLAKEYGTSTLYRLRRVNEIQ